MASTSLSMCEIHSVLLVSTSINAYHYFLPSFISAHILSTTVLINRDPDMHWCVC